MMHTTSVGPEVSLYSSASDKLQCSWTSMKVHVGPGAPSTKTPWGEEYLISPVLCRSLPLCSCRQLCGWDWRWQWSRGASPTNALGVAVISAGLNWEGASWRKSAQDLGWRLLLWQRSLLCFQLRRPLELPAQDQFGTLRCPFMSSAKDGLLRWVDCDTCLLTLKALQFREWCMPAASTGVSTSSGYVTAGGADPTTLSRIEEPLY